MTDAQEALDEYSSVTCTDHLDSFVHNHHPTIERALRLLAAVEAGEWKVVPTVDNNYDWYLDSIANKPYSISEVIKDCLWVVQENIRFDESSPDESKNINSTYFCEKFSSKNIAYFCYKCKTAEFLRNAMLQAAPDFFAGEKEG